MPTLNIEGVGRVKVSDDFLQMSPQEQESAVDEIAKSVSKGLKSSDAQPNVAVDVAKSLGSGLERGVVGLPGMFGDIQQLGRMAGGAVAKVAGIDTSKFPSAPDIPTSADVIKKASELGVPGLDFKPQTKAGELAQQFGELAPGAMIGPGKAAVKLGLYAAAPAAAITATRDAAERGELPAWAPAAAGVGTALLGGGTHAIMTRPGVAERMVTRAAGKMQPQQLSDMERLFQDAQNMGIPVSRAEAAQEVTGGATRLSDLQRVIEGQGELKAFYSDRPATVRTAASGVFDQIATRAPTPSEIGPAVATAARQAIEQSPEGAALSQNIWATGPRVTPEEAGSVIQPELRKTFQSREGMRSALADKDYEAARNAPATIPLDGYFSIQDVSSHYSPERPWPVERNPTTGRMQRKSEDKLAFEMGISPMPIPPVARENGKFRKMTENEKKAADEQRWQDLEQVRAKQQAELNKTETMPVVGQPPTQFGQVDASGVAATIDKLLETAKGTSATALRMARKALDRPDGTLETSVAGLDASRKAITDLISQAKASGVPNTVRQLEDALTALDRSLDTIPEYATARKNFEAASKPLAPFGEGRVPGAIVERDEFNQGFVMPPERAPKALDQGGASAAEDFVNVASGPARDAYVAHLTTQALDKAGREGVNVSASAIRDFLRTNEDALKRFPEVTQRLEAVAQSREALDPLLKGELGKLIDKPDVKKAAQSLFPEDPSAAGGAQEIGDAVGKLASKNPWAARQLVRAHLESTFNKATQRLQSGTNQFGGASWAAVLRGNTDQAARLEAAIRALPNGDQIYSGFNTMMNVMEATGQRQRIGSNTAFNTEALNVLKQGEGMSEAAILASGFGLKWPTVVMDRFQQWRLGKNSAEVARLLTDPKAASAFRDLATTTPNSVKFMGTLVRLTNIANQYNRDRDQ